jgi:hypothetical protein
MPMFVRLMVVMFMNGLLVTRLLAPFFLDNLAFFDSEDEIARCAAKVPADCCAVVGGNNDFHRISISLYIDGW